MTPKIIFIVVVPWDYARAEAVVFFTREEAEQYIAHEVDEKARDYATIQEEKV